MLMKFAAASALMLSMMGVASAQDASSGAMADVTSSPTAYVTAAGQSDQFEVQEGRLAMSMGKSQAVKDFGAKMIKDHTKSTQIVMKAASKDGLPPMSPPPLRADQQQMIGQLQGMSGASFDHAYVEQQLQAHQQALQVQQAYAQNGTAPHLKMAAGKIVPVVQEHISMLQSMSGTM